jgi:hypothetical protein
MLMVTLLIMSVTGIGLSDLLRSQAWLAIFSAVVSVISALITTAIRFWLEVQSGKSGKLPTVARRLIVLVIPEHLADGVLGDIAERYDQHLRVHGYRHARRMLRHEVFRSILPIVRLRARRLMAAALARITRRRTN